MNTIHIITYATGAAPRWLYFHLDETPGTCPVGMFCWLIDGPEGWTLVDVGANEADTTARFGPDRYRFENWRDPVKEVSRVVDPAEIKRIICTHIHWDHLSPCLESYPNAVLTLQRKDLEARLNPPHPSFRELCFDTLLDDLESRLGNRLNLIDGDTEIAPGIRTLVTGGHTLGHQAVLVETHAGVACITGDLVPVYENLENDHATCLHEDLLECYRGMERIRQEADIVIPGHDARVLEKHPDGIVGR